VVTPGVTVAGVPLVTAPTELFTLPVPPLNTPVSVVELPTVIVGAAATKLVIAGAATTLNEKDCVAFGNVPLLAVMVIGEVPGAAAVPEIVAVPFPLSVKLMPPGNAPVLLIAGVGPPLAITLNVLFTPAVNVTLFALVMVGAWTRETVIVNNCVALGATPLLAVIVMG
jgi:hypothetical protein